MQKITFDVLKIFHRQLFFHRVIQILKWKLRVKQNCPMNISNISLHNLRHRDLQVISSAKFINIVRYTHSRTALEVIITARLFLARSASYFAHMQWETYECACYTRMYLAISAVQNWVEDGTHESANSELHPDPRSFLALLWQTDLCEDMTIIAVCIGPWARLS